MSLSAALASQVSATIRDRGRDYFRSGAVTLESVGPVAVEATVKGSEPYTVDLALDGAVWAAFGNLTFL